MNVKRHVYHIYSENINIFVSSDYGQIITKSKAVYFIRH